MVISNVPTIWNWGELGELQQSNSKAKEDVFGGFYGGKKVACITKLSNMCDAIFLSTHQLHHLS